MREGSGEVEPGSQEANERLGTLISQSVTRTSRNSTLLKFLSVSIAFDVLFTLGGYLTIRHYQLQACQGLNKVKASYVAQWKPVLLNSPDSQLKTQFEKDLHNFDPTDC